MDGDLGVEQDIELERNLGDEDVETASRFEDCHGVEDGVPVEDGGLGWTAVCSVDDSLQ